MYNPTSLSLRSSPARGPRGSFSRRVEMEVKPACARREGREWGAEGFQE